MNRNKFAAFVRTAIAAHPEWLSDCLLSVSAGAQDAISAVEQRRAQADSGMLAALALVQAKRLTPDAKKALTDVVRRAINPKNMSASERKFLENCK